MRLHRIFLAAFALVLAQVAAAGPGLRLRLVATGLEQPTEITHARDGSGRIFITERTGRVRVLEQGALLTQPFLDLSASVSLLSERGLLGLAFSPDYRHDGLFYVMYTALPDDNFGGALRISQFRVSPADRNLAQRESERILIEIPHPAGNHNGGKLAFAEGLLHIATGDGGGGGDLANNAQNPASVLGKILRIEPRPDGTYIPRGAFVSKQAGFSVAAAPEVLHYGLRNPWRFSFDRASGDLYIGDVGQGAVEEIDFVPYAEAKAGGQNFGWRVLEGNTCFNPSSGACQDVLTPRPATYAGDPLAGSVDYRAPIATYLHDAQGGNSVTGGYVYRGVRSPQLQGYYIYGDFGSSRIWAARRVAGMWLTTLISQSSNGIAGLSTFGEDEDGELYVASMFGSVFALEIPFDGVPPRNVARASRGATATASSRYGPAFDAALAIDGDLAGYWADGTPGQWPDTLQVAFDAAHVIDRIVVYGFSYGGQGLQPFDASLCEFTSRDFDVQARVAGSWRTVGEVRGNTNCKRTVTIPAVAADAIAIQVLGSRDGYAYVTEVEAWTVREAPAAR